MKKNVPHRFHSVKGRSRAPAFRGSRGRGSTAGIHALDQGPSFDAYTSWDSSVSSGVASDLDPPL